MTDGTPCARVLGEGSARIWGMSSAERLGRIFARAGVSQGESAGSGTVVLARADHVFDEALIKAVIVRPDSVMIGAEGAPVAAHVREANADVAAEALLAGNAASAVLRDLTRLDPADLTYNSALRKREAPVLERLDAGNARAVEARLFQGSYKGITDLVTKYVWPVPARIVTRWCALTGISPNQVTFASLILVLVAMYLFWIGQFGWGLVAAWVMTFLDTVDGKLARVTLRSSPWGNVFDHGIDLIHPPFWWWAWLAGVQASGFDLPHLELLLAVIVGGYVAQRIEEGIFIRLFGMHMHAWRRFDSFFRLITARRNPNLLLLSAATLVGRPDIGLIAVGVWTALCLVVHAVQIVQGLGARRPLVSWLEG
ncbi:MAG: CDP-alcohol phosphatidyltransferase family protein [Brevundimonas mediterranea]|jgi:phosphatidylglycerophosphate synthase